MALKDYLTPTYFTGKTLRDDFRTIWTDSAAFVRELGKPYSKNEKEPHSAFSFDAITLLLTLTIVPALYLQGTVKALGKSLLGLVTWPYFLFTGQGKSAASWLGNNAGSTVFNLISLVKSPIDSLLVLFVRMPARGISTAIANGKVEANTNSFKHTEKANSTSSVNLEHTSQKQASVSLEKSASPSKEPKKSPGENNDISKEDFSDDNVLKLSASPG